MSEELTLESLELKKPLEKLTAKELRELVIDKLPMITGVSGMDKDAILAAIKEVLGIVDDDENKVNPYKAQILKLKKEIRDLRTKKTETEGRKAREIIRRKINKLKKRTRRLSASA